MKIVNKIVLILLLLIPFQIYALDDCTPREVTIKSVDILEKSDLVEEKSSPTIDKLNVGLDLSFVKVGDYINYGLIIKNNSNKEYKLNEDNLNINTDYLSYTITYEDGNNIIQPNSEKKVYLRVAYDNEVSNEKLENGFLNEEKKVNLNFSGEGNKLVNPPTGLLISFILLIVSIFLSIVVLFKNNKKVISLFVLLLLPISTYAICTFNIEVTAKTTIDGRKAVFLTGSEVNVKMKRLAGDDAEARSFQDQNIKRILYSAVEPSDENKQEANIVSMADSLPIYMWFDDGTIYWWSEDKAPELNQDASHMLDRLLMNDDISGVVNWDSSNVELINSFLQANEKIISIEPLKNWDISNVTDMSYMFNHCFMLESLEALSNWDVSNVNNFRREFAMCYSVKSLEPLSNWNLSSASDIAGIFYACASLKNLKGLESWDTSNVVNMQDALHGLSSLVDASAISDWNVSKVESMLRIFNVSSDDPLGLMYSPLKELNIKNWDLSNVEDFGYFVATLRYVKTEFTIRRVPSNYYRMFTNTACEEESKVVVNYTAEVADVIDDIIATKSNGCNVVKGELVE